MKVVRCALYTRKSSEEGLDQAFNSLDAQREACAAYVASQKGEGWKALATPYDDGGYSGGSMDRPALQRLLTDISAGKVDVVVVYKIDRLTRSLMDFARIVETFDARQVSFVSVTQAFNTTTSMGRLTLNVLLSFAQFEREVTGERIRDKLAASKAKGMWMGGRPPLGYDPPTDLATRALVVNPREAETVRLIFERYLELGSVHALRAQLAAEGVRSKKMVTRRGVELGGEVLGRGPLFHLLRNKVYRGIIVHQDKAYPGAHPAIIDAELFDAVQRGLEANVRRRAERVTRATAHWLKGAIFDAAGSPMSPSFGRGGRGQVYRYYVSAQLQQGAGSADPRARRVAAQVIERAGDELLARLLPGLDEARRRSSLLRLEVHEHHLEALFPAKLHVQIKARVAAGETLAQDTDDASVVRLATPLRLRRRGGRTSIDRSGAETAIAKRDPKLVGALRSAHRLIRFRDGLPELEAAPPNPYFRKLICLALLAPDLQANVLAGRQPEGLSIERLMEVAREPDWEEQRRKFRA